MASKIGEIRFFSYRFLLEGIVDSIPLLGRLKSPYNLISLTVVYTLSGVGLAYIMQLQAETVMAGVFGVLGIIVITSTIMRFSDSLRNIEVDFEMNKSKQHLLTSYLDTLFSEFSLVLGVFIFCGTAAYFFTLGNETLIRLVAHEHEASLVPLHSFLDILLFFYIYLLLFDISYRLGLNTWIGFTLLVRNWRLSDILHISGADLLTTEDFRGLVKDDQILFWNILGYLLFVPFVMFSNDIFLIVGFGIYVGLILTLLLGSYLTLSLFYPSLIPEEPMTLLRKSPHCFVGIGTEDHTHLSPCLFVFDGRKLYFSTSIKSHKIRFLTSKRGSKRIAIFVLDKSPKSPGVLIQGNAEVYGSGIFSGILYILLFGVRMLWVRYLFSRKYPKILESYRRNDKYIPAEWKLRPILSRTIVEVTPEKTLWWKGSKLIVT